MLVIIKAMAKDKAGDETVYKRRRIMSGKATNTADVATSHTGRIQHQFWQPFQPIDNFEQALAKTRTGVLIGIIFVLQAFAMTVTISDIMIQSFAQDEYAAAFELWLSMGVSIAAVLIGTILTFLLHRYQWWWVVVLCLVLGMVLCAQSLYVLLLLDLMDRVPPFLGSCLWR